jgi:hypothetical protein
MKNTLHTPGPWDIFPKNETLEIGNYGANAPLVSLSATVPTNDFEGWANARLISSAPDLIDLLEAAIARVQLANEEGNPILSAWLPDALSTLRKAKGEA